MSNARSSLSMPARLALVRRVPARREDRVPPLARADVGLDDALFGVAAALLCALPVAVALFG